MPYSGGAFFLMPAGKAVFFRAEGYGKNIFAGKLKYAVV